MPNSQTLRPRVLQNGLLALTMTALTLSTPGAADAFGRVLSAPLALSGLLGGSGRVVVPIGNVAPIATVAPLVIPAANWAERAQAVHCLSEAVYYEAGTEGEAGQRAVAQVVLNRVRDRNFPDTVCGVVFQGWTRRTGCQFSFVCDGSRVRRRPGDEDWRTAKAVAERALNGYVDVEVGAATHYHADYVAPTWRKSLIEVSQVGAHIFYRWPGRAGDITALSEPYKGGEVTFWNEARRASPKTFGQPA